MPRSALATTVHNVLDPLTGARQAIRWMPGDLTLIAPALEAGAGRELDGTDLWLLPPLYDADAQMPFLQIGIRQTDICRALTGGIAQFNTALPWQLAQNFDLGVLSTELGHNVLPKIIPLLSVSPDEESAGFPTWLRDHAGEVHEFMPPICKLYSYDPNFERNLEAVWGAGLKPVVWCVSEAHLEALVARAKDAPLHHRHATSSALVALMRKATASSVQTSPHFLLLAEGKHAALTVLPPPPAVEHSASLAEIFLDQVDIVVTDDNAPPPRGKPTGPGLQTQQHFLQALLTLAETHRWPLDRILAKATTAPAGIFGTKPPEGFLLVDPGEPEPAELWPGQAPDRAPFEGLAMRGKVLAVGSADRVELL